MKVSCIHPGVAPRAVVLELAPEHGCPHGDRGSSSPAEASAPPSLSQPGQIGSLEACCFHLYGAADPPLQPAPLGPGYFPNSHWSLGPVASRRASRVPTLPSARACPLLKQPDWLLAGSVDGS